MLTVLQKSSKNDDYFCITWDSTWHVFALARLFADDIALFSDTVVGLQNQLNILNMTKHLEQSKFRSIKYCSF